MFHFSLVKKHKRQFKPILYAYALHDNNHHRKKEFIDSFPFCLFCGLFFVMCFEKPALKKLKDINIYLYCIFFPRPIHKIIPKCK